MLFVLICLPALYRGIQECLITITANRWRSTLHCTKSHVDPEILSEIQIVCDRDEKEVSIPSSPFKAPSPSLKDPSPLPSPSRLSPHICEEASLIETRTGEAKEAVEEELLVELEEPEVGVEAEDLFRDIALRTEALSAPTSFKFSQRQRYYK